jgi:hypothetical protein
MTAREEVLGRIRTAPGPDRAVPPEVRRDYRLTDGREPGDLALLDLLTGRLEDYKATLVRSTPGEVAATATTALRGFVSGDVVLAPGLPAGWRPDGAVETTAAPPSPSPSSPRRSPGSRWPLPRPAPWFLTAARSQVGGRCRCCPTAWSAWSGRPRWWAAFPRGWPASTRSRR